PKIARMPKERYLDPKWASVQRELLDPIEISLAYLDKSCRPSVEPEGPYWPQSAAPEVARIRDPWENSIESLSFNPLEHHVKSLCRPW
ncbi:unnamed protein product, partial [Polarella glacialis]